MLIYLVRHGDRATPSYNSNPDQDKGLTPLGKEQAALLAKRLKGDGIQAIYSSQFPRAIQTSMPIEKQTGLKTKIRKAFGEIDVGKWNGLLKSKGELEHKLPGELKKWATHPETYRFPGGENLRELRARVMPALKKIIKKEEEQGHDRICIVSHDAVCRMILFELALKDSLINFHKYNIAKASVTIIKIAKAADGKIKGKLLVYNDISHLKA